MYRISKLSLVYSETFSKPFTYTKQYMSGDILRCTHSSALHILPGYNCSGVVYDLYLMIVFCYLLAPMYNIELE